MIDVVFSRVVCRCDSCTVLERSRGGDGCSVVDFPFFTSKEHMSTITMVTSSDECIVPEDGVWVGERT